MDKKELKKKFIEMYLEGKTYSEIAKLTGWSRTFVTNLIKDDKKIIEKNHMKKIKVYKTNDYINTYRFHKKNRYFRRFKNNRICRYLY